MKIMFNDGTEEVFSKADINNSCEEDSFYRINDEEGNNLAEVNLNLIKMLKW